MKPMWKKVVGPTLLVCLCWLCINGATTFYIQWVSASHDRLLRENVASVRAAGEMQVALWQIYAFVLDFGNEENEAKREGLAEIEADFERALVAAEQAASTQQDHAFIKEIRQRYSLFRELVQKRLQQTQEPAMQILSASSAFQLAREVAVPCKNLLAYNDQVLRDRSASHSRLMQVVRAIRIVFIIVGPTVGLLLGFAVSRNLHKSISSIHVTLQGVSSEFEREIGKIEVSDTLELPQLHQMVQEVVSRFRDIMGELQQARREVVRAERLAAVGELAAGIAHELRNPLTSVKLLIQMAVQRSSSDALGQRQFQVVIDEIARMDTTIQGLLDFAKPPTPRVVRHDLRETVKRAINLIAGRSQQQNVTVSVDFPEHSVLLDADPDQLQQVFVNLLLNGIEAMPNGGVMSVVLESDESKSGLCRTCFKDSGNGIDENVLERMFEPFVTTKEQGTGLGLAVSRRIVEGHGGVLRATNVESGGSLFTVELPQQTPLDRTMSDSIRDAMEK